MPEAHLDIFPENHGEAVYGIATKSRMESAHRAGWNQVDRKMHAKA